MSGHAQMLSLYRNIVRNARVYPSKSRDRVLKEIRSEVGRSVSCRLGRSWSLESEVYRVHFCWADGSETKL